MVALLEGLCFERYGARAITLDVLAYDPPSALTAQEAVGPSRNSQWYRRLGYVDFKVRARTRLARRPSTPGADSRTGRDDLVPPGSRAAILSLARHLGRRLLPREDSPGYRSFLTRWAALAARACATVASPRSSSRCNSIHGAPPLQASPTRRAPTHRTFSSFLYSPTESAGTSCCAGACAASTLSKSRQGPGAQDEGTQQ